MTLNHLKNETSENWEPQQKVIIENPLEYSPQTKLKLDCPPDKGLYQTKNPYIYTPVEPWNPQPQFWYKAESAFKGPTWPVGDIEDYRFKNISKTDTIPSLTTELEIECEERYIPGEIYKNKTPKDLIKEPDRSKYSTVRKENMPEVLYSKFDELTLSKTPSLADLVKEKEQQLRSLILPYDDIKPEKPHGRRIKLHEEVEEIQESVNENDYLQMIKNKNSKEMDNKVKHIIRGPDPRFVHTNKEKIMEVKNHDCKCCHGRNDNKNILKNFSKTKNASWKETKTKIL